jgi:integrase
MPRTASADIDLSKPPIRWRAEADKKRKEWCIPIPAKLAEAIRSFQRRLGAVGGWIFAAEKNPEVPMDRHLFDKWLAVAENEAGLPKLDGGLWHPYRRKWATERKHLSLKDVAAAGGWNDVDTLLRVYQQADPETLLAVMSEPRKASEAMSSTM